MATTMANKTLNEEAIRTLSSASGPCITILLPAFHPGAQQRPRRLRLKNALRAAQEKLEAGGWAAQASDLLAPIREMAESKIESGGQAAVLFRSAGVFELFDLPDPLGENTQWDMTSVAKHFYLLPFIAGASLVRDYVILGLSRKRLKLFECSPGGCREMPLPPGVPSGEEQALWFDQPDHAQWNRSYAGPGVGGMQGVSFQTSTDRERALDYLRQFFMKVDTHLSPALHDRPLLLMGVHEEVELYRQASAYKSIFLGELNQNAEFVSPAEAGKLGSQAAAAERAARASKVLEAFEELRDPRLKESDTAGVLLAAAEGRVHQLCARAGTQAHAGVPRIVQEVIAEGEDLVNAAAAETLKHGGSVFVLPQDRMPADRPLAAILRY
jgi:hypothetical protein